LINTNSIKALFPYLNKKVIKIIFILKIHGNYGKIFKKLKKYIEKYLVF